MVTRRRNTEIVAHTPYVFSGDHSTQYSDMTDYQAPSGAWVFAAGTVRWPWGLSNVSPWGPSTSRVSTAAQIMTNNVLNRFLGIFNPSPTPNAEHVSNSRAHCNSDAHANSERNCDSGALGHAFADVAEFPESNCRHDQWPRRMSRCPTQVRLRLQFRRFSSSAEFPQTTIVRALLFRAQVALSRYHSSPRRTVVVSAHSQ